MPFTRLLRLAISATAAATLVATAATTDALASAPAGTHVVVHVTPTTVLQGTPVAFTGSISPKVPGLAVVVQHFVGGAWVTIAHEKVSATGALSFSVKAPKTTGTWILRVARAAAPKAKLGVSGTLHLRVVAKAFAVTAKAKPVVGQRVTVSGVVSLKATGSVSLQMLVGKLWHSVATAKLSHAAYSVSATLVPGARRLRVAKTFSTTIAGGLSPAFTVSVPSNPRVVNANLPSAQARRAYSATLTASGGVGPYTWTGSGLPDGLSLTSAGALSGTAAVTSSSTVAVTVRDSGGRTGSASFSLVVARTAGQVWSWGSNDSDQLGNGSAAVSSSAPTLVVGLDDAVQVVGAGSSGAYALRSNGTVASWGVNTYGALGNGTGVNSNVPVAVTNLTGVIAVDAGIFCGNALKSDGTVWSWGYGGSDQLGNNTTANAAAPVQASISNITSIASNGGSTYALRSDGTVWAWGQGGNGALGNGANANSGLPVQVSALTGVIAIAGGSASGYALKSDHTVWAWGWNFYGQLGNNSTTSSSVPVQVQGLTDVSAINAGFFAGMALKADGTMWDWGYNQYGALGNNSTVNSSIPVAVSGLATVVSIAGGGQSGYAVKADGTAWAWGHNDVGELGNGTTTVTSIPVAVAVLHDFFSIGGGYTNGYAIDFG